MESHYHISLQLLTIDVIDVNYKDRYKNNALFCASHIDHHRLILHELTTC